ncbi:MAG: restriction endonuclease subunit S [Candidatus Shapirobacteria bacterium]|jgi:type I restriction enzyme S subunit
MKPNWPTKRLVDLYEITSSKRVFKSEWKSNGIPFYRAREIVKLAQNGFVNNELFISKEMFDKYSVKYGIPKEGDIMVTGVGTLGICYVVKNNDKFYFKDGNIIWLKKKSDVITKFVEYAFKSDFLRKQIDNSAGATVGTYTIIKAKNTIIPLPPLPEQIHIVEILDDVFEDIKKVKENTEKNLQNFKDLFESYLDSIFNNPNGNFENKKIKDIAEIKGGKRVPRGYKLKNEKTKYPYIRVADFNNHGNIDLENIKYVDKNIYEQIKNYTISTKDLYISIAGTIGKTGIIPQELEGANLTENSCKLVFKDNIYNRYIYFFTKSTEFIKQAGLNTRKVAMPKLALTRLGNILIPIPKSISEQKAIVAKLDTLAGETKNLEVIYKQKLADLEELKKSILSKAFSGEL